MCKIINPFRRKAIETVEDMANRIIRPRRHRVDPDLIQAKESLKVLEQLVDEQILANIAWERNAQIRDIE
jgi:hypothetical protein